MLAVLGLALLCGCEDAQAQSRVRGQVTVPATQPPATVAPDPLYTPPPSAAAPAGASEGFDVWETIPGCVRYLDGSTVDDAARTYSSRFRLGCAAWPGGYVLELRALYTPAWTPTQGIGTSVVADDRFIYLLKSSGELRIGPRPYKGQSYDQVGGDIGWAFPGCFKGFVLGPGTDKAFGLGCAADGNGNFPILLVSRQGLYDCAVGQRAGRPCTLFPAPAGGSVTQLVTVRDWTNHLWLPLALTSDGGIWRGTYDPAPTNTARTLTWNRMPGCGRYVSGDQAGRPWVIGCDPPDARGNYSIYRWNGLEASGRWELVPGRAVRLFWVADEGGAMYAVLYDGTLLRYKGT